MGNKVAIGENNNITKIINKSAKDITINRKGYFYITEEMNKYWMCHNDEEHRIECHGDVMCSAEETICVGSKTNIDIYENVDRKVILSDGKVFNMIYKENEKAIFYLYDKGISKIRYTN